MPDPILSPALTGLDVRHAFFTRVGGVSSGLYESLNGGIGSDDDPANVRENRARMAGWMGVAPDHFLSLYQIHSPTVLTVTGPWATASRPQADAMVTTTPGIALAVGAADCGPILFADPRAGVVGAAHSGWKGAIGGVLEATLLAMEVLGASRSNITVALGPMLSQQNYEVGPEFRAQFVADDSTNADFFRPGLRPDHSHFDLPGFIARRLKKAGAGKVEDCGLCTYADEARFYSYRRKTHRGEADYGRLLAAIRL
ncbi:yfiH Multicopper polyphenol oxidase (laccase) [Rhabdaerophilaceae bacterium]